MVYIFLKECRVFLLSDYFGAFVFKNYLAKKLRNQTSRQILGSLRVILSAMCTISLKHFFALKFTLDLWMWTRIIRKSLQLQKPCRQCDRLSCCPKHQDTKYFPVLQLSEMPLSSLTISQLQGIC